MRYGHVLEKIRQWISVIVLRVTPSGIGPRFVLTGAMVTLAVAFASAKHQPAATIVAWILCSTAVLLLIALHQATNNKFAKLSESLESIGLGELSGRVETILEGESGRVVESVQQMNRDLAAVVEQVRGSSDRIAVAARETAAGGHDLSQRTEEQAAKSRVAAIGRGRTWFEPRGDVAGHGRLDSLVDEHRGPLARGHNYVRRCLQNERSSGLR
jgi:methyl-accepting chemotaxis protein